MVVARELVGVTKSSKKPFKLAEFVDNKWSLSSSNLCITNDMKPSKDGSILELKCDNKMVSDANTLPAHINLLYMCVCPCLKMNVLILL